MTQRPYRGKRKDNGEWVEGWYHELDHGDHRGKAFIMPSHASALYSYEVDSDTVEQSLGIPDRNGVQIFVGDICRDSLGWVYAVTWDADNSRYIGRHSKPRGDTYICYVNRVDKNDRSAVEIIGNIHDNPELLTA